MTPSRVPGGGTAEALALAREVNRRVSNVVRRTPGLLVLSFVLGIALWIFVTDTENPTVVDAFPAPLTVEAVNVDSALAVANQLASVEVRVSAATDRWQRLTAGNFRAYVDLNGFEARSQEVPVRVEVTGISGVRVLDTNPRVITVNLEPLLTNNVPVTTRIIGQLPIGYELGAALPVTQTVAVRGPASLVALVSEAVADVNVTGLTAGVEPSVALRPQGAGGGEVRGVRLDPATAKVSLQVTQSTIVRTIPLTLEVTGVPERGFRVSAVSTSPAVVQVQGSVETLRQLDRIALPAVNIAGVRADVARTVDIPLPPGVSVLGGQRATITVNVAPVNGSQRTTVGIGTTNVPDGLIARPAIPTVDVILHGPLPTLNSLLPGDVRVEVNVGGRGRGTYTLTLSVSAPEGITVESVQPATVAVTIAAS